MTNDSRGMISVTAAWILTAHVSVSCASHGVSNPAGGSQSGGSVGVAGSGGGSTGTTATPIGTGGASEGAGSGTGGVGGVTNWSGSAGAAGAGDAVVAGGSSVALVITSAEGSYWQQGQATEVTSGNADVTVNDSSEAQTWEGFGGAFTELGWVYLSRLSQVNQDQAISLLFGSEGARFTWGRLPIGGNDFVTSHYTLDDTGDDVIPDSSEANRPPVDLALSKFSIDRDLQNLIPYVKAALAVNPNIRFWAVPWTPPVWMKTGFKADDDNGGAAKRPSYYDGGSMKSDAAILAAHAQYFVRFVRAYKEQGINIELVAPQNEPVGNHTYPSCMWDATTYTSFIGEHLGPALSSAGLSTKVMLGGSFDSSQDTAFVRAVLADSTAKGYCAVAGVGYDMANPSKVSAIQSSGLPIWVSEHKAGNYPWNKATYKTTAPNDMAYAIETWGLIRDAITTVGVTAYNAWHMVLDKTGKNIDASNEWAQDSLLVADFGQLTATPAYYVFRHFSRFVEPGAKVVATNGSNAVAFKNPDTSLVVVLYNSGTARTMTIAVRGRKLQFAAPGNGFVTLVNP
jgi:glucosylceramidase